MTKTAPKVLLATLLLSAALVLSVASARSAAASDEPPAMYGNTPARNMVSEATGLPDDWDLESGKNIVWRQKLGSQSYAGPTVYAGRVFAGTNNEGNLRPGIEGDKGVLVAYQAKDGKFLWQATHDKLSAGRVNDWPLQGICSTPYAEGDRVYYVSNRATVVAADVEGFANGNQGVQDEKYKDAQDGDILWEYDMIAELDVFPHNLAAGSPLIVGDILFTVTGNGVDEGHVNTPSPLAPSFIALDKNTGKLIWEGRPAGDTILHGTWSNPSYGVVNGSPQVAFPAGDGWVYTFEPKTGHLLWKFDLNPKDAEWELGGSGTRNYVIATPVFYKNRFYLGVGQDPEHGEAPGHFYAIDATKEGDVTGDAQVFHVGGDEFNRTLSTAAIHDGIVYISDLSGFLYALDAETGQKHWTHDTFAAIWGSPFVADGKVYLGDEDGDVAILKTGKKLELIREVNVGSAVYTTPSAKDGVLYIVTRSELLAIAKK